MGSVISPSRRRPSFHFMLCVVVFTHRADLPPPNRQQHVVLVVIHAPILQFDVRFEFDSYLIVICGKTISNLFALTSGANGCRRFAIVERANSCIICRLSSDRRKPVRYPNTIRSLFQDKNPYSYRNGAGWCRRRGRIQIDQRSMFPTIRLISGRQCR
jgi:hypothetical protein